MTASTDLRCPIGGLLAKVTGHRPLHITDGNLIELACRDCRRKLGARQVLHRFNVAGQLVESVVLHDE